MDINDRFRQVLNDHGYGFQYAVIDAWKEVGRFRWAGGASMEWRCCGAELPIVVRGLDLHIDAVFELASEFRGVQDLRLYAALETKRPDPAYSAWLFAKSGVLIRAIADAYSPAPGVDSRAAPLCAQAGTLPTEDRYMFDVSLECKTKEQGNSLGKRLDASITQALRASAGFAEVLPTWLGTNERALVIPVIVTSAKLYCLEQTLNTATPFTGNFDAVTTFEREWVWLSTNVSASLSPTVERSGMNLKTMNPVAASLLHRHTRGVMIINSARLDTAVKKLASLAMSWDPLP